MVGTNRARVALLGALSCFVWMGVGCDQLPATLTGGCGSDEDCKNQRICVDGACESAPVEAAATKSTAEPNAEDNTTAEDNAEDNTAPEDNVAANPTPEPTARDGEQGAGEAVEAEVGALEESVKEAARSRWLGSQLKSRVVVRGWGVRESEVDVETKGDTHHLKVPVMYGSMKLTIDLDEEGRPDHLDKGRFWMDGAGGGTTEGDFTCEDASTCEVTFSSCFHGIECYATTLELTVPDSPG